MRVLLVLVFFLYASVSLACSCEYDYGSRSSRFLDRAAALIGEVEGKDLNILRYELDYTVLGHLDPTSYGRRSCGCTSFVKRVWDLSYEKNGSSCVARVILQVWNDKMKLKSEQCE